MLIVPLGPLRDEIAIVNSRFIASLSPVESAEEARGFIVRIREEFPDATHNVPAFIIGGGNSTTEYCSDDGEPSGTSGRPLLAVLKGSGMGNIAVVVTRYFGGTLLGTGGLVRAYTAAGRLVVERVRRAAMVEMGRFEVDLPYALFDRFRIVSAESEADIVGESFAEVVHLAVEVPLERARFFRVEARGRELRLGRRPPRFEAHGATRDLGRPRGQLNEVDSASSRREAPLRDRGTRCTSAGCGRGPCTCCP